MRGGEGEEFDRAALLPEPRPQETSLIGAGVQTRSHCTEWEIHIREALNLKLVERDEAQRAKID